eukprot:TRINITY_DN6102_c1_g1_i1.p1 TRINITY_DN6102_c1_g1~~TRINITY_DN6102_c1_g1_i1.p1  ORF type:complete len:241 (+),score=52.45 TRINITY_DN6102_c1_g1_i1:65-787(+)
MGNAAQKAAKPVTAAARAYPQTVKKAAEATSDASSKADRLKAAAARVTKEAAAPTQRRYPSYSKSEVDPIPRHEAGSDATTDPSISNNSAAAASAAALNIGTDTIRHPSAPHYLDNGTEGRHEDANFLDVVKQLQIESKDQARQLDPAMLEEQSIAHRTGPAGKQLDRTLETQPAVEMPEDEIEGRLNFIQMHGLLTSELAKRGGEAVAKQAEKLHVSEHDLRCMLFYYRVPVRKAPDAE